MCVLSCYFSHSGYSCGNYNVGYCKERGRERDCEEAKEKENEGLRGEIENLAMHLDRGRECMSEGVRERRERGFLFVLYDGQHVENMAALYLITLACKQKNL